MKHTIHVPGTRCTLTLRPPPYDYKNKAHRSPDGSVMLDDQQRLDLRIDEISKALTKCTGKHNRHVLRGGDKRLYPQPIGDVMLDTASYVKVFFDLNRQSKSAHPFDYKSFFEPLSTRPQEWPQEPLYEELTSGTIESVTDNPYKDFFDDCVGALNGFWPAASIEDETLKATILDAIAKGDTD